MTTANVRSRRQVLRWAATAAVAGVAMKGAGLRAAEPPASSSPVAKMFSGPLQVTDLGDGQHVIAGGGGNTLVSNGGGEYGLLVIDSGMNFRAKDLLAAIAACAPDVAGGRKVLFNTHWHRDHTGGNADFAAAGYVIVGSDRCRQRMGQHIVMEDMGNKIEPSPLAARPAITFAESLELAGTRDGHVVKIPPAHTDTDAVVLFGDKGVLHTGDLLFAGTFPVIDRSTGGSLDGMIASTKQLMAMIDDKTKVIPGHGPVGIGKDTLAAQLELLGIVRQRLAPFGDRKVAMDEVLAKQPLADLDERWGRGFLRSSIFTRMAYGQWVAKRD